MSALCLSEKSQAFRYSLLTAKIIQVLSKVEQNHSLMDADKIVLSKGNDLIEKIIAGAALVEGKTAEGNLTPSQEGLSAYGYALSSIEVLSDLPKTKEFTNLFKTFLEKLLNIRQGRSVPTDVKILKAFFSALGAAFRGDIQKELYSNSPDEIIKIRTSMHATSLA